MLSEIKEQPEIIKKLAEYYLPQNQPVQKIQLNMTKQDLSNILKIYIVASGSSRNAGNIAKYVIENIVKLPVEVDYASEFAHRNPNLTKNDLVIAISQSGETADTFSALKIAHEKGAHTLALTNNPQSKIHNLAESQMQIQAGKEKSIAATKSFTAQLINLYALALYLGEQRNTISPEEIEKFKSELHYLKNKLEKVLENIEKLSSITEKIKDSKSIILIGRGLNFAVAQEGALKIKETDYIDANGYPSGEFLHGYLAIIDKNIPIISIIVPDINNNYKLAINNTEEIKQKRNPNLIIIKSQKDKEIETRPLFKDADFINIPEAGEEVSSIFTVVILQLLAFKIAKALGLDTDNPRGLSKTIVSE
ncbi:MAG: SIS domain-containing protein [bacterium]